MKWLIYLLLLLNIALFAWHYRGGSPDSSTATESLPGGVTRLVLLREQQPENQEKQWCYSLGPVASSEQAEALIQQLSEWHVESWQRKSKEAKRKGYWVLLPPLPSRAKARAEVEKLKAKDIEDYFLIATGDKANGISLGVFSKFESAHRRIKQMNKLGFKPELAEVKLPAEEYWLDWLRDEGEGLTGKQLTQLRQDYEDIRQIERGCEPPAQPAQKTNSTKKAPD